MDAGSGASVRAGQLVTAGAEVTALVTRSNFRVELSPRSVAEFEPSGSFHLLRGSALMDSREEASMRTTNAKVEFAGKVLVSYDHKETSSSVFVLAGEARLANPHQADSTLRLPRFRGATLVVADLIPQLIRQLDVGAVDSWLAGYSWPGASRKAMLRSMPGEAITVKAEVPPHLESAKLEDYFSSIDTADEQHQPDYYEKKFGDPDKVLAEQNSRKGAGKVLSPEEAALISLPKNKIDLGFELGPEFLSAEQKQKELETLGRKPKAGRSPASTAKAPKKARKATARSVAQAGGDTGVNLVLERLRQLEPGKGPETEAPAAYRGPASAPVPVVPDPVYDYSRNF
jgi:hypothetical protein